jgi:DNA polymerase
MTGNSTTTLEADKAQLLIDVRERARSCQDCPLWEGNTQTVFGDGPASAKLMFIGEGPGQHEDRTGTPFVGPAGRMFDEALAAAGIERAEVFVTNVVKHRPWVQNNGRRKNRAPKRSEIKACHQWLASELEIIQPDIICCLGAVAAKEILGKEFRLTQQRGEWFSSDFATHVIATIHPAFVLIQPEESYSRWKDTLFSDIESVAEKLQSLKT